MLLVRVTQVKQVKGERQMKTINITNDNDGTGLVLGSDVYYIPQSYI